MNNKDCLSHIYWVDEYVRNIAPYIYVREYDNLLIKIPNEAFKLNPQGIKLLTCLLSGVKVDEVLLPYSDKEKVAGDIHAFFCDLRAMLKGCYHERQERRATEQVPFDLSFTRLPVLSEIALTYRCNLACRFCYVGCGCKKEASSKEMAFKEIKSVLDMIKDEAEVPSVSFTGGEPTLRNDLVRIIGYAHAKKMWTNLITNATLITQKKAAAFKKAGLDSAQVSLEAGTAELHDMIVRHRGAFYATLKGLAYLKDAGIRVHTNTTISKLNKAHLLGLLELIKGAGFDKCSMNMLMPEGSVLDTMDELFVSYSEIGDIVLEVFDKAKEMGVEFMWYSPTPMCIFNPVVHGLGNKGCAACDGLLSVSPRGEVLPCSSYPRPMANMLAIKGRFKEIWFSQEFAYFKEKKFAHKMCQQCADLAVCNGGCPLYWKQAGYDELTARQKEALV